MKSNSNTGKVGFKLLSHPRDGFKDAKGKIPSDHGCHLHDAFEVVFDAVNPCGNNALDRIRHLDIRYLPDKDTLISVPVNGTVFQ